MHGNEYIFSLYLLLRIKAHKHEKSDILLAYHKYTSFSNGKMFVIFLKHMYMK